MKQTYRKRFRIPAIGGNNLRRILSVLLVMVLLPLFPVTRAAAEEPASVEEQIRAYADSIDQSKADDSAAMDLALHGIGGGGKKLTMNASSPMAATLLNSELVQTGMTVIFADIIDSMQRLDLDSIPEVDMSFGFYGANSTYGAYILTGTGEYPDNLDWMVTNEKYTGSRNAYDSSLEWMVGNCSASTVIECIGDSASAKTYRLTVTFQDRFDFSTANSSGFKKFLSAIGMLLFKEFDWSCTVTMEITAPYSYDHCSHSSGAYQWIYDGGNHTMTSVSDDICLPNNTNHRTQTTKDGKVNHYYELDSTIRLEHQKPWVLEYDVSKPVQIIFAPVDNAVTKTHPQITQSARTSFYIISKDYAMAKTASGSLDRYYAYNYYGTKLHELFPFAYEKTYTFRLENEVSADGSNRIYLSATETQTGEACLERIPMDDYYYYGGWMDSTVLRSTESTWLSGKNIHINYFGTGISGFDADTFELRIWENGVDNGPESHWAATRYEPTCTAEGYTIRTCGKCGLTERVDVTPALGHSYEARVTAPTCTEMGYTTYTCHCGSTYVDDYREPTGKHIYEDCVCTLCGAAQPGDINTDRAINALDLILLRQYLAGWDVAPDMAAADTNGDRTVNALDLILLRQYLAGWDVTLGP